MRHLGVMSLQKLARQMTLIGPTLEVLVPPANVTDQQALPDICPDGGMILKNNMQGKDHDKDRWLGAVRMPFEGVFAWLNKRARYRGTGKSQFQAMMRALAYHIKRLPKIAFGPIPLIEA